MFRFDGVKLSADELRKILMRPSVADRNPDLCRVSGAPAHCGKAPVVEPAFVNFAMGSSSIQKASRQRFRVCVCSIRKRLLDEDNLSPKYCIDLCRAYGYIPNDNAALTRIEVTQRKCGEGEAEQVEIIISKL